MAVTIGALAPPNGGDLDAGNHQDCCAECAQTRTALAAAKNRTGELLQVQQDDNETAHRREVGLLRAELQRYKDERDATLRKHAAHLHDLKIEHDEAIARTEQTKNKTIQTMQERHRAAVAQMERDQLQLQTIKDEHEKTVQNMEERLGVAEKQRRKWLSQVQALRGGFRVVCRMRPLLPGEEEEKQKEKDTENEEKGGKDNGGGGWLRCRLAPPTSSAAVLLDIQSVCKAYPMDEFLGPSRTIADVADEIEPLVHSLVFAKGATRVSRGVVLASGQTASGKTTCIRASLERVADVVYDDGGDGNSSRIKIACSFVQVYGDEYSDLFADIKTTTTATIPPPPLKIPMPRSKADGFMLGAQVRRAASRDELISLLVEGSARRYTCATTMNVASSRSHTFFTMVFQTDDDNKTSMLTLVDLAGSERSSNQPVSCPSPSPSSSPSHNPKEGIEINKSLMTLRTGFARLTQANNSNNNFQSFFRGNKMTELLGYMLGEDARTVRVLVLLTINPAKANLHQSISTLEFGALIASRTVLKKKKKSVTSDDRSRLSSCVAEDE